MNSVSTASSLLWIAGPFLQTIIAGIIVKNRLYRELPVFFCYTIFHVVRSALLFMVKSWYSQNAYAICYFAAELASVLLGFAVIYEVFNHVLRRYEGIRQLGLMLFRWSCAVLTIVAIISSSTSTSGDLAGMFAAVLSLERSIRIIQCGLLVFLFLFSSTLALSWRHYVFGIAVGFGFFASIELILIAVRAQVGPNGDPAYVLLKPLAYVFACIIWTGYLVAPAPAYQSVQGTSFNDLERWNQTVLGLLHR